MCNDSWSEASNLDLNLTPFENSKIVSISLNTLVSLLILISGYFFQIVLITFKVTQFGKAFLYLC